MAPRKRIEVEPSTRVTRSSSRLTTKVNAESPKKKKAKKNPTSGKKSKPSKFVAPVVEEHEEVEKVEDGGGGDGFKRKTIIIEYCKQCQQFKIRAMKVKSGLEKALADGDGVNVILNPEKPRRGCFEIREEDENGEKFISLLNMVRPFTAMKALDMDKVVADIIEKIK